VVLSRSNYQDLSSGTIELSLPSNATLTLPSGRAEKSGARDQKGLIG
jgi:hypothetical protein